jgi:hypothetical protein
MGCRGVKTTTSLEACDNQSMGGQSAESTARTFDFDPAPEEVEIAVGDLIAEGNYGRWAGRHA